MDAQSIKHDELASTLNAKQKELENLLEQFQLVKNEDTKIDYENWTDISAEFECLDFNNDAVSSQPCAAEGGHKNRYGVDESDITLDTEIIEEDGNHLDGNTVCYTDAQYSIAQRDKNQECSSEFQKGEKTICTARKEVCTKVEGQISESPTRRSEMKATQTTELTGWRRIFLPDAVVGEDQDSSSEFQNGAKLKSPKRKNGTEVGESKVRKANPEGVEDQILESQMLGSETKATQTGEFTESKTGIFQPYAVIGGDQESTSEFQNGAELDILRTKEEENSQEVVKMITESPVVRSQTKATQTEEMKASERDALVEDEKASSLEFQSGAKMNSLRTKNEVKHEENKAKKDNSKMEKLIPESKTPSREDKATETKELTEAERMMSLDNASGKREFCARAQYSGAVGEGDQGCWSHFRNGSKTSSLKAENEIKIESTLGEGNSRNAKDRRISGSQTFRSETKAKKTEEFTAAEGGIFSGAVDAGFTYGVSAQNFSAVDDGNISVSQTPLRDEILNSSNILNKSGIIKDQFKARENEIELKRLTGTEKKRLLKTLAQHGTSSPKLISPEDIRNLVPKGLAKEIDSTTRNVQCEETNAEGRIESAVDSGSNALLKSTVAPSFACNITTGSDLRTLEDALTAFGLYPRLQQLERILEDVRRCRKTPEDHETECKRFDKDLQKLSLDHHPDRVKSRGGSDEEVTRAQKLQTALNATRTVLNTLNKIFLEDIDIDHRYEFFTKLDIGVLGNEDEVENHVYEILFKISLLSEIKQEGIIAEIRKFLTASQDCVKSCIQSNILDFLKHRNLAFFHLKRCITGYQKLLAEFEEVEEECKIEKLDNIYSLMHRIRCDCSRQLKHLEALFELSKSSIGENFRIYSSSRPLDDYFVFPFVCYVNVIMACSIMVNKTEERSTLKDLLGCKLPSFFSSSNEFETQDVIRDDEISLLYYLASYYGGSKRYKRIVKGLLGREYVSKLDIEQQFSERLIEVLRDLESKFKIDDYIANGTNKYIVKELKICMEMKAEFEQEKASVANDLKQMKKNREEMRKGLDKLLRDGQEVNNQLNECLADTKTFKAEIENISGKKMAN